MFSKILTSALIGIEAKMVYAEVDLATGLPTFQMVGNLGSEVKESRERIWAAMKNIGIPIPISHITVNLSPADVHKDGTSYDLPIAIGILCGMELLSADQCEGILFLGELGLDGKIKPIRGVLPILLEAAKQGIRECIIPAENALEGSYVPEIQVRGASSLSEILNYLQSKEESLLPSTHSGLQNAPTYDALSDKLDFSQVRGQESAKRAAVIAAAGFHSLLMSGPPGAGKSMLAKRIPGIMPPLTLDESLEVTSIHSVAGKLSDTKPFIQKRGFSEPHHSISTSALIGGGAVPRPGEISLAHRSVLFLDELPEFDRRTLDSLRQPMEDHKVRLARARATVTYPADFLLVCAMNPCPCGYYPDRNRCHCSEPMIRHYLGKISGPILDRIDLCVELKKVDIDSILNPQKDKNSQSSRQMQEQVQIARSIQEDRFRATGYRFNSELDGSALEEYCKLSEKNRSYLKDIYIKLDLSARSYHRILRVARTIADLARSQDVEISHLSEAICFRPNLEYWRGM